MQTGALELGRYAARRRGVTVAACCAALLLGALLGLAALAFAPGGEGRAVLREPLPSAQALSLPRIVSGRRAGASAPLVVIDAGHGGFDPGASGAGGAVEKRIVLSIALALRDRLLELGAVRVALTREDDSFLPLSERVALAEALEADLFVSIHADSAPTETVRGANAYVLAARATDPEALAVARLNNETHGEGEDADPVAGEVQSILAELARREIALASARLADSLETRVAGRMPVHGVFRRGANLVVLHSVQMPSLLFEAGYISSPDDAARLMSADGRQTIAEVLAEAIVADLLAPGR